MSPLPSLLAAEIDTFFDDLPYWYSRARGRVLDFGCRAGRLCAALRRRGIPCAGLDTDREALFLAGRFAPGVPLVRAPLDRFALRGFGSAFASLGAFQRLTTREERARSLACLRAAVGPGGYVFLDLAAPVPRAPAAGPRRVAGTFEWDEKQVTVFETARRVSGLVVTRREFFVAGKPVAETVERAAELGRKEVEDELRAAGFDVFALFRDWKEGRWEEGGPRLLVEAAARS